LSLYTGAANEVPKWNGWAYFFFSMKEFAIMGAVLAVPFAIVVATVISVLRNTKEY